MTSRRGRSLLQKHGHKGDITEESLGVGWDVLKASEKSDW
jgi:hypothetical protein